MRNEYPQAERSIQAACGKERSPNFIRKGHNPLGELLGN